MKCFENRNQRCVIEDDLVNTCIGKMIEADGIILGSPVYFLDITSEMKALIDRAGFVSFANGHLFSNKIGNAAVAVRRTGASRTCDSMLHFFLANDMMVPGLPCDRDRAGISVMSSGMGRVLPGKKGRAEYGPAPEDHEAAPPCPRKNRTADERMTKKKNEEIT